MRFNETCVLVAKTYEPDDEGVMAVADERTEVFCNPQHVGANTWSSMYEIGISVDAKLQVRTADYDGQRDVFYQDEWYSVETVERRGDMTLLTLRHQKSDTDDDPSYGKGSEESGGDHERP